MLQRQAKWMAAVVTALTMLFSVPVMLRQRGGSNPSILMPAKANTDVSACEMTRQFSVPVLMYHRVDNLDPRQPQSKLLRGLTVSPETFRKQMEYLVSHGYRGIPLDNVENAVLHGGELPKRAVAITFDDGYDSVFDHAYPVLRKYGLPATIFVVTSVVGRPHHVTWDELRLMKKHGIDCASHTVHHPDLTKLSLAQIDLELRGSRIRIKRETGESVDSLAYPGSRYDVEVVRDMRRSGYLIGWRDHGGPVHPTNRLYYLPRVRISGRDSMAEFKRLMRPHSSHIALSPNRP